MTRILILFSFCLVSLSAQAADYRCYSSKYPTDMQHYFQDGYVDLTVRAKTVKLDYYYVNTVADETTLEYSAVYNLGKIRGGNGRLKGLITGRFKSSEVGSVDLDPIYFQRQLINNKNFEKRGIVGKFVFSGHGYSYDWNVCYNLK